MAKQHPNHPEISQELLDEKEEKKKEVRQRSRQERLALIKEIGRSAA